MLAQKRQLKIYNYIQEHDAVSTSKLVSELNVSLETVRRDLLEMEKNQLLKRVHGGAVKISNTKPFIKLEQRHRNNESEKLELVKNAILLIDEGDLIAIDSGSTSVFFAQALKQTFTRLTVVTHSLDVFQILHDHMEFDVILCAGNYMKTENAFYGMLTLDTLDKLHVKKGFICPSAVSLEFGVCDYTPNLCMIQRKMMNISDNVFILADNSKFEKRALIKLSEMRSDFTYVTDRKLKPELKKLYNENDINIITGAQ